MDNPNIKYKQLYENVKILKNKIYDLEEQRKIVEKTIKKAMLINDNIVYEDKFNDIKAINGKVINEMTNTVIPNISNKI